MSQYYGTHANPTNPATLRAIADTAENYSYVPGFHYLRRYARRGRAIAMRRGSTKRTRRRRAELVSAEALHGHHAH